MALRAPREAELYRVTLGHYGHPGNLYNGAFRFPDGLMVIISDGDGWEHASVSRKSKTPSYEDMDRIKRMFWDESDCVMQLHVPTPDHIDCHPHTLHLWRPVNGQEIPRPPAYMVGPERVEQ